jgi:hypothetical protein
VFLVLFNCFYALENFKIQKTNTKLRVYAETLQQHVTSLKGQNTYESLDLYKDKIIKKSNYRQNGEEVLDFSGFDQAQLINQDKVISDTDVWQKWFNCVRGQSELTKRIAETNNFCK